MKDYDNFPPYTGKPAGPIIIAVGLGIMAAAIYGVYKLTTTPDTKREERECRS